MAGTATVIMTATLADLTNASKLIDVNFTGVAGDVGTANERAVISGTTIGAGVVARLARGGALALLSQVTNAPGGNAGDLVFGVIEGLIGTEWYQFVAQTGQPMNVSGAANRTLQGVTWSPNISSQAHGLFESTDAGVAGLLLTANVNNFPYYLCDAYRIAHNVTSAGVVLGAASIHSELWFIPHRGTVR